jgi:hypothetical protein
MSVTKKLLILLGAGASAPCGMPSVRTIDEKMKQWCTETVGPHDPLNQNGRWKGIFNDLWDILTKYYSYHPRHYPLPEVNFETVLAEMTALDGWVTPAPSGNALRDALRDSAPSERFTWSVPPPGPYAYSMAIKEEYPALLTKLARYMRRRSQELNTETASFTQYKDIFSVLMRHYDIGIYTLNYDDVVLKVCPGLFTGFAAGEFEPRLIGLRTEWGFAYHLHGSVHYSFISTPADHRIVWQDDLNSAFTDARTWPDRAESRKLLVPTTLIAGGFKLDQLLADPFHTVYAAFNRHTHEADAILIIGYGFGDAHVNPALRNRYFRRAARRPPWSSTRPTQSRVRPDGVRTYGRQNSSKPFIRHSGKCFALRMSLRGAASRNIPTGP